MKILVTGAAGFVGFHVAKQLLEQHESVIGVDNLNDYYSVKLKKDRLSRLQQYENFSEHTLDIAEAEDLNQVFAGHRFDRVIHLAAQVGVRYSLENPAAYVHSNLVGFANILEACRRSSVEHLVYASSSSVYGANSKMPFSEHDPVDHPISLYAATKRSNELMAHSYSHLFQLPTTGLRFFTVYGPWGRPDMAPMLFTRAILDEQPIKVFNKGKMQRDFTYVDDIVAGVTGIMNEIPAATPGSDSSDPARSPAPFRLFNIGHNEPVELLTFISCLEDLLQKKAKMELLPLQPGDVLATYADIDDLGRAAAFQPRTPLNEGLEKFVAWYLDYYGK